MLRLLPVFLASLFGAASAQPAALSPFAFGAADDPLEMPVRDARPRVARLMALTGPSYIGVSWRGGIGLEADLAAGPLSLGIGGRLRVSDGLYEEDFDDTYDLLRLVRYARLDPTPRLPVYARVGPVRQLTLGPGHLVRAFQTTSAWDHRTVGLETAVQLPFVRVMGVADDVRLNGLVGGRGEIRPFERALSPFLQSVTVGATAVTDLRLPADTATTAFAVDARLALWQIGDFALSPYASYARFTEYGSGYGGGVEFASRDLAGFGRLGAAVGFSQSGERFIPGYFNAFYALSNPGARILDDEAFFASGSPVPVGTPLDEAAGGFALNVGLHALVFNSFEFAGYVQRDFSGDDLTESTVRLAFAPGGGDPLRFVFEVQQQGRSGFFDLFTEYEAQNVLVFHLDYALPGPAWLVLRSRYGYERLEDGPDGEARYLVERRFEPFVGVRVALQ
ncbi:MAG: hypothetical protein AAGI91_13510 [Bacteroidota bacterium]